MRIIDMDLIIFDINTKVRFCNIPLPLPEKRSYYSYSYCFSFTFVSFVNIKNNIMKRKFIFKFAGRNA